MPPLADIVLAAIAILATLAFALLLAPAFVWVRRRLTRGAEAEREVREGALDPDRIARETGGRATAAATVEEQEPAPDADHMTPDPTLEDRVIRIVSWAFLMAVAVFAAASGAWPEVLAWIVILIAVTGEIMLILQDILPRTSLKRARGPLQGILALVFASSLVAMTGGLESPFTFTFPLIVGAGALLVAPRIALA